MDSRPAGPDGLMAGRQQDPGASSCQQLELQVASRPTTLIPGEFGTANNLESYAEAVESHGKSIRRPSKLLDPTGVRAKLLK